MTPGNGRLQVAVICPGCGARTALATLERDGQLVVDCRPYAGPFHRVDGSPATRKLRLTIRADEAHHVVETGCRRIGCLGPVDNRNGMLMTVTVCACQLRRLATRTPGRPWGWRPTAAELDAAYDCECGSTSAPRSSAFDGHPPAG